MAATKGLDPGSGPWMKGLGLSMIDIKKIEQGIWSLTDACQFSRAGNMSLMPNTPLPRLAKDVTFDPAPRIRHEDYAWTHVLVEFSSFFG